MREKAARSIAAIALGFLHFDKRLRIIGIILNNVAGDKHANFITDAFAYKVKAPIVGIIRRNKKNKMEERHLGLIPTSELQEKKKVAILQSAKYVSEQINIDKITDLLNRVHRVHCSAHLDIRHNRFPDGQIKIAIAMDESFNFYYADNLDALRRQKAHLVFFSPVNDSKLPENISGSYSWRWFPGSIGRKT